MLRLLSWGDDVERAFFAGKGRELPRPHYNIPDGIADMGLRFRALKATIPGDNAVEVFLRDVSAQILEAQRPIRVLRILAWGDDVERAFFAGKGRELPRPEYRVPVLSPHA